MTPEQTPQEPKPSTESIPTDSADTDKIIDTKTPNNVFADAHGDLCYKKLLCLFSFVIGVIMGLIIFYMGLSSPESDYKGPYEIFQFFMLIGISSLGLSTAETFGIKAIGKGNNTK